jgi:hypothetical protein
VRCMLVLFCHPRPCAFTTGAIQYPWLKWNRKMHRHITAGDRGKTVINGELIGGVIAEVTGDDSLSFRADVGTCYSIHRRSFMPDYKSEAHPSSDDSSSFPEKENMSASERHKWICEHAYFRWLNDARPHGQELTHWCEAERAFDASHS